MLLQASVSQVRKREITRKQGYIVITMCFYPRGLRKTLRDEYRADLAPSRSLFKRWQKMRDKFGHDLAMKKAGYEEEFTLSSSGLENLERLSVLAKKKKVFLVCQCAPGERCHREMLLMTAKKIFKAKIGPIYQRYPKYARRLVLF